MHVPVFLLGGRVLNKRLRRLAKTVRIPGRPSASRRLVQRPLEWQGLPAPSLVTGA
jgi:hypothetical protein